MGCAAIHDGGTACLIRVPGTQRGQTAARTHLSRRRPAGRLGQGRDVLVGRHKVAGLVVAVQPVLARRLPGVEFPDHGCGGRISRAASSEQRRVERALSAVAFAAELERDERRLQILSGREGGSQRVAGTLLIRGRAAQRGRAGEAAESSRRRDDEGDEQRRMRNREVRYAGSRTSSRGEAGVVWRSDGSKWTASQQRQPAAVLVGPGESAAAMASVRGTGGQGTGG